MQKSPTEIREVKIIKEKNSRSLVQNKSYNSFALETDKFGVLKIVKQEYTDNIAVGFCGVQLCRFWIRQTVTFCCMFLIQSVQTQRRLSIREDLTAAWTIRNFFFRKQRIDST